MMYRFLVLFIILTSCSEKKTKNTTITLVKDSSHLELEKITKKTIDHNLNKDFILGKFDYKKHPKFTKTQAKHSSKTIYLDSVVYNAFKKMYNSAQQENINLKIISGTRSFFEQKYIWERKWKKYKNLTPLLRAKKILEYSSMPTTSRHHWGTDIDINALRNSYFEKGQGKKEYDWLINNANSFGFYQVYTTKTTGRTGYNTEKWHWSYLPLANQYLDFYNRTINYKDINGFIGAEHAKSLQIISDYVNGVDEKIKLNYQKPN